MKRILSFSVVILAVCAMLLPDLVSAKVSTKAQSLKTKKVAVKNYNCADFTTHKAAQAFFIKAGGPKKDPHGLDRDKDGIACEALP